MTSMWHDIITFVLHTQTNNIGRGMFAWTLGNTQSNDVGHEMPYSPLGSTHGRMMSGVTFNLLPWNTQIVRQRRACHHCPWITYTIRRCKALHAIMDLVQHTWLDEVARGRPSSPLDSTDGLTTMEVQCHHRPCGAHTFGRHRPWQCHYNPWNAHTIQQL